MGEVLAAVGTVTGISYFEVNSDPQRVGGALLPCSIKITANSPAAVDNVVAQGDRSTGGCPTVVVGHVKAERISNKVTAFTYYRVTGA